MRCSAIFIQKMGATVMTGYISGLKKGEPLRCIYKITWNRNKEMKHKEAYIWYYKTAVQKNGLYNASKINAIKGDKI